jgi:hypothetical protein
LGKFGDWSAEGEQFNGLGFELGCVLLSWFGRIHGWILLLPGQKPRSLNFESGYLPEILNSSGPLRGGRRDL